MISKGVKKREKCGIENLGQKLHMSNKNISISIHIHTTKQKPERGKVFFFYSKK